MSIPNSDYIVFADESGDHSITKLDTQYPIFVLVFCIFKIDDYFDFSRKILEFKFKHFGHDIVVLHEHEIRNDRGKFNFLKSPEFKENFMTEITDIIQKQNFEVIATVINKENYINKFKNPTNVYDLSLEFCLERLFLYLKSKNQITKRTNVVIEARGLKDDTRLIHKFNDICDGNSKHKIKNNFEPIIAIKGVNSSGLQLADLIARPIGLSYLRPEQINRTYDILKEKYIRDKNGNYKGVGFKLFP